MGHKTKSFLPLSTLFLILGLAIASGGSTSEAKQPEWLIDPNDGSMLIPGVGRVMLPPLRKKFGHQPHGPIKAGDYDSFGQGYVHVTAP